MQLDIFNHSRDVMLRNDASSALAARDAGAARAAVAALQAEVPGDDSLPAFALLLAALEAPVRGRCAGHSDAATRRHHIDTQITPAANRVLVSPDAVAWLAPLWVDLAADSTALGFDAHHGEDHAAALWLRAGRPTDAATAAATIPSWRRIPLPLAWMTEARWRSDGIDEVWPFLAELAWLAPARAEALVARLAEPLLLRLHKAFGQAFDGDDGDVGDGGAGRAFAWFPAWVLTDKPALASRLAAAEPGLNSAPEQALRLLVNLLGLEHQGRHAELMAARRRLQGLQGWLYAAYMRSR